jgi:mRNA-degrading endonuclease RelE of RelBE toxin-antitoxin system|tara:strand:+ start:100 stop:249 length:150 start_codon:yes stop_codon:yes gene_type:complete
MEQQILLLTPETRQKLKKLAAKDGRSISKFIEKLIDKTWRQQGGKKKAA